MRVGKIASLTLFVLMTSIVVVVLWLFSAGGMFEALAPGARVIVMVGFIGLGFAVVLLPFGIAIDRSLMQAQRFITAAGEEGAQVPRPSRWLSPITNSFVSAVDRSQRREESLRNHLRDLQIRHQVTQAQGRQVETVLNALRDPVLVTDSFNEIILANEAAARTLGFDLEVASHQSIHTVLKDAALCDLINDTRESGNVSDDRRIEHDLDIMRSGEATTSACEIVMTCVEDHRNKVSGVVTIIHDLSREREISRMKSDFVSKASHELRTPLSAIRGYVEMLVDGDAEDDEARHSFYEVIHSETERLGRLIDNMLNISRIEAGLLKVERDRVDMRQVADRVVKTIEPEARRKKISLNTKLAPVDLSVEGDEDMLFQVLLNLVSNAIKYTPDGGRVTLHGDSDNLIRGIVMSVADTGLGLSPSDQCRVFDKFYRVENYKRIAKGTGLGLNLCKNIVEKVHRGQIGIDSTLGMGSRFWFTIPMNYEGARKAA
ncbi:MAG: ATP-binding protein [Phycisphaerales bacterium]|nr:ATP-binding protein [Phycisphaerales bacterium]